MPASSAASLSRQVELAAQRRLRDRGDIVEPDRIDAARIERFAGAQPGAPAGRRRDPPELAEDLARDTVAFGERQPVLVPDSIGAPWRPTRSGQRLVAQHDRDRAALANQREAVVGDRVGFDRAIIALARHG
jgi:hypothetical protein